MVTFQEVKGICYEITVLRNIKGFSSFASSISVIKTAKRSAQVMLK